MGLCVPFTPFLLVYITNFVSNKEKKIITEIVSKPLLKNVETVQVYSFTLILLSSA